MTDFQFDKSKYPGYDRVVEKCKYASEECLWNAFVDGVMDVMEREPGSFDREWSMVAVTIISDELKARMDECMDGLR